MSRIGACAVMIVLLACQPSATAQEKPVEQQIAEATSPLPAGLRDGARVMGFQGGTLVTLREGTNHMTCLADAPGGERWHVACYHSDLEPYMTRGRELRAEGIEGEERMQKRWDEIEAGALAMPERAALMSLTGPEGSFDPETGEVMGARSLHVVYIPYATEADLGISSEPSRERPWLMFPGTAGSHIMIPGGAPPSADSN